MPATYILSIFNKPSFHCYPTIYCTHILHHMWISDNTSWYNWFHIALFLLSVCWHSFEINFNKWRFLKTISTYFFFAVTYWWLFRSEYQSRELSIHSHMNAQTMTAYTISNTPESNSALQSFGLRWQEQTVSSTPISSAKLKKIIVKSYEQWEHDIRIYCILNTEINIILLHWNKQHFESGIIQWGCCLLDENFHLFLMVTCFTMQVCHMVGHWAIESTPWRKIN